MFKEEFW